MDNGKRRPTRDDYVLASAYVHDEVGALLLGVRYDPADMRQFLVLSLHGSQVELAGGVASLFRARRFASLHIVHRSFIEATVDIRCLLAEHAHGADLLVAYHEQAKRILEEVLAQPPPDAESQARWEATLAESKAKLKQLREAGAAAPKTRDRFTRAGMMDAYVNYMFDAARSHGNLVALMDRHLPTGERGDLGGLQFYRAPADQEVHPTMAVTMDYLLTTAELVHAFFKTGHDKSIPTIRKVTEAILAGIRPQNAQLQPLDRD